MRVARIAAIFAAFFPSLVLWSSQGLKDGPIIFLLSISMLATLKLGEKFNVKYLLVLSCALFGLLSLFLLYPGGATLGIVLTVLGAGIWIGVQRLGYHEFFELSRVAQRTIEQKRIIKNNLALRRGARSLALVQNVGELRRVLDEAFRANAFDGYRLDLQPLFRSSLAVSLEETGGEMQIIWRKASDVGESEPRWSVTLDLSVKSDRLGTFTLYRAYTGKPLMIDLNLLITDFQAALAESLHRLASPARSQEQTLLAGRL